MKTAMQELIDKLNNVKPTEFCSIETIKEWAESLLEKEKEQIKDAYDAGWSDRVHSIDLNDEYYFETFNTHEK